MIEILPIMVLLEVGSMLAALVAALISLMAARHASIAKKILSEVASRDPLVNAELVKFYRDRELSEPEVRAIVRALTKAIEKDLVGASGQLKARLNDARSLIQDETGTPGHRLFKELAAEASCNSIHAAA